MRHPHTSARTRRSTGKKPHNNIKSSQGNTGDSIKSAIDLPARGDVARDRRLVNDLTRNADFSLSSRHRNQFTAMLSESDSMLMDDDGWESEIIKELEEDSRIVE